MQTIVFKNIKITCVGNITFTATADADFDPGVSKVVEVFEDKRKYLIQMGQDEIDVSREFTVTLSVYSTLSEELWPEDVYANFESTLEMTCEESFPLVLKARTPWTVHCTITQTGKTTLKLTNLDHPTEFVTEVVKVVSIKLTAYYQSKSV